MIDLQAGQCDAGLPQVAEDSDVVSVCVKPAEPPLTLQDLEQLAHQHSRLALIQALFDEVHKWSIRTTNPDEAQRAQHWLQCARAVAGEIDPVRSIVGANPANK